MTARPERDDGPHQEVAASRGTVARTPGGVPLRSPERLQSDTQIQARRAAWKRLWDRLLTGDAARDAA
jgi:hypothetical protein